MLLFCSITVSLSFFLQPEAPVYLVPWQVFARGYFFFLHKSPSYEPSGETDAKWKETNRGNIYRVPYKIDKQQGPTVEHRNYTQCLVILYIGKEYEKEYIY